MPYFKFHLFHITDIPNCPFYQVLMLHILGSEENIMNEISDEHDARIREMALLKKKITQKVRSLVKNQITITCE